jgi:hypothetical protein
MHVQTDRSADEPIRGELRLLLLLVALSPFGLLTWLGFLLALHWSLSTAWAAVVGV